MKHSAFAITASMTFVVGLALTPAAAIAAGSRGGSVAAGHAVGSRSAISRPVGHRPSDHPSFGHRPFFRPGAPFSRVGAFPVIFYAPPLGDFAPTPTDYGPPVTYDLPAASPPAAYTTMTVAPAPPPPAMSDVVQYPHGRYELRGDGVSTPYVWVWIPNPPPAPPAAAPGPPASPTAVSPPPERRSQVYRWTDERGVSNWTDRWDTIPARYRAQAERI
jgi:hypothetical protein